MGTRRGARARRAGGTGKPRGGTPIAGNLPHGPLVDEELRHVLAHELCDRRLQQADVVGREYVEDALPLGHWPLRSTVEGSVPRLFGSSRERLRIAFAGRQRHLQDLPRFLPIVCDHAAPLVLDVLRGVLIDLARLLDSQVSEVS